MKRIRFYCLLVLFAVQMLPLDAQTTKSVAPGFRLTLSLGRHSGEIPKKFQVLLIAYTNISDKVEYENMCGNFGNLYHLAVTYNGVPQIESEDIQKERKIRQSGRCHNFSGPQRNLQPGESREDNLYYDTTRPGIYVFTVDVDTSPLDAQNNVTVTSNTITVVVPAPGAGKND
jgi:hypothetical protein